ncbi:osmoprotectant transport system permease protein [Salsuginibacillus halophilus]|uniref:Osmoprotectant transport system permease protein n=1 Tax=Salsuginibacillus halophilus TaxID=517424 RepID=A0A2P8HL58_9BACI|nr:ABC transporter permease [Salsuginibacillus halophilus]PSL46955.1 osmoprotectant transport system permease protein [Salsuginibacillus halophilus]
MNSKAVIAWIVKIAFWVVIIAFFWWTISNNMYAQILENPEQFAGLLGRHLQIVLISSSLALLTAVPAGILLTRPKFKKYEWIFVNTANLGQTIPSIAILALAMGFLGIGIQAAILALYVYSLLPILQNTIAGLKSVDPAAKDAAAGMGMTPTQILFKIELPMAASSMIAGIRTAIVLNIGTTALAYLIGGGGLGVWIFTGIQLFDNTYLISGAVPVTILAITVDQLFRVMQLFLVPKGIRKAQKAAAAT